MSSTTVVDGQSRAAARSQRLLQGPILVTLVALALPNIVVMVAQAAANFLESYYVGLLGVDALAGAALVFPLVMLMQMMSAGGIGGGIASSIARALGAGRPDEAEAIAMHAILLSTVLGLIFGAMAILFGPALYTAMGGTGPALDAALRYSNAIFAGAVFLWLLNCQASILRGSGNMVLPALVLAGGVLILLVTSPTLIFGYGPIPALGVRGAGLALVLYYVAGSAGLAVKLHRGRSGVRLRFNHRFRPALLLDILRVGGPAVINNFTNNIAVIVATSLIAPLGAEALAGFGLGIRLEYLQIPLVFGIGSGMVAMVGMNVGAQQLARARLVALTGACMAAGLTEAVGLAAAWFPHAWLHLFTRDEAALRIGVQYLHVVAPGYGFFGFGLALYFASQGAKRMAWSVWAGLARVGLIIVLGFAAIHWGSGLTPFLLAIVVTLAVYAVVNVVPWVGRRRVNEV